MAPKTITKSVRAAVLAALPTLGEGMTLINEYQQPGTYRYVTVGQPVKVIPRVGKKFTGKVTKIIAQNGEAVEVEVVDANRKVRTVLAQYVEGKTRKGQET